MNSFGLEGVAVNRFNFGDEDKEEVIWEDYDDAEDE